MTKTCSNCQQQIGQDAAFCGFCGAPYKALAASTPTTTSSFSTQPARSQPQSGQEQVAPTFHFEELAGKSQLVTAPAERELHGWLWYCFSLKGRIGVRSFWLTNVATFAVFLLTGFFLALIDMLIRGPNSQNGLGPFGPVLLIMGLLWYCSIFAVFVKRIHDLGRSGLYLFVLLIPIFGQIAILILIFESFFSPGTDGPNKHGDFTY